MSTSKLVKFTEMKLSPLVLEGVEKMNFKTPTPIQSKVIPTILNGKDVLASAQTGTGKTAAFCLPTLNRLLDNPEDGALILTPTREIGIQILKFIEDLALPIKSVGIIGGLSMRQQLIALQKNPRIIIATPGRILDHLRRKTITLSPVKVLILDEADRMLDMGFAQELNDILNALPKKRQTLLFSATIQGDTQKLANKYLHNPVRVAVGETSKPVKKVQQISIKTDKDNKFDKLMDELNSREGSVLMFVKTKYRVEQLAKQLLSYGYQVRRIHGDRTQNQRNTAIQELREGKCRILVATDVASRGIDIPSISIVINYDPPFNGEDYVHRIGRTGRAGAAGTALNFMTFEDVKQWDAVQRTLDGKPAMTRRQAKRSMAGSENKSSGKSRFPKSHNKKNSKKIFGKKSSGKKTGGKKKSRGKSTGVSKRRGK